MLHGKRRHRPAPAASVGAAIQGQTVRAAAPVLTGRTYSLPPVCVANQGRGDKAMTFAIDRLTPHARPRHPGLVGTRNRGAGQPTLAHFRVVIPATARPGRYVSDLVVSGSAAEATDRARI